MVIYDFHDNRYTMNFTLNFTINENQTSYVGEIFINEFSKDMNNIVTSKDEFARDISKIKTLNSKIDLKNINRNYLFRNRLY